MGEGLGLRGGSGGLAVPGMARAAAGALLPLLLLPLVLSATTRWMRRSTVATALLLSFTAPPLTVWMRVRCFRVVGNQEEERGRGLGRVRAWA